MSVKVTVEGADERRAEIRADYLVVTAPVPIVREWEFRPAPEPQRRAFEALTYRPATRCCCATRRVGGGSLADRAHLAPTFRSVPYGRP